MRTDVSPAEGRPSSEPRTPEQFAKLAKKKMLAALKQLGIERGKSTRKEALVRTYSEWYEGRSGGAPSDDADTDDVESTEGPERRRAPRAKINVEIGLQTETNFFVGFSGDISEGGIFVTTIQLLDVGTEVTLSFSFPGGIEIEAEGVVAWTREGLAFDSSLTTGLGIRFVRLSDAALSAIKEFISIREPLFHEL